MEEEKAQQHRDIIGGGSAGEGKGRGNVSFKTTHVARSSDTSGSRARHESMIMISVVRGSSTAMNKGNTLDTAKREKDGRGPPRRLAIGRQLRGRLSTRNRPSTSLPGEATAATEAPEKAKAGAMSYSRGWPGEAAAEAEAPGRAMAGARPSSRQFSYEYYKIFACIQIKF